MKVELGFPGEHDPLSVHTAGPGLLPWVPLVPSVLERGSFIFEIN